MSADARIRWLHQKILSRSYPNARLLAERFGISCRQAERDVEHLRHVLKAPIAYSRKNSGFYYTAPFSLPSTLTDANDESQYGISALSLPRSLRDDNEEDTVQLQIPYTAVITCPDKLAMVEFRNMVVANEGHDRYRLEFHSVSLFLSLIFTSTADISIDSPAWLRDRLADAARRVLNNNPPLPQDE